MPSRQQKILQAIKLFVKFRGEEPKFVESLTVPDHTVMLLIGECDGILYTTRRDGKLEKYVHRFKQNSRPLLASSFDGTQLYLLGGAYDFTDQGIVDK